jgi:8-hydroxy-5-deazaflavin:NADPH oxidoreductase
MKITVIGRGNIGGGLAKRWERAGHDITALGHEGGDASDADVVVVAVYSDKIADALAGVSGLDGKVTIDATNDFAGRDEGFESLAHQIKSVVGGPIAKAFNLNFAALYDQIDEQRTRPGLIYASEDGARDAAVQLIEDAGFEPVYAGGLENARMVEDHIRLMVAINQGGLGQMFYRYAAPGDL